MALHVGFPMRRPANKDFQWQDNTEELFESFIDPDSFNLPSNPEVQRNYSNDFISFFEAQALQAQDSTSSSASFDTLTMPDMDTTAWHQPALSTDHEHAPPALADRHLSVYSIPYSKAAASETDLGLIVYPTTEVTEEYRGRARGALTAPSTPRNRTKSRNPLDTPLSIRKRNCSSSPSKNAKIDKSQRKVTVAERMRKISPRKSSHGAALLHRHFQERVAGQNQLELKLSSNHSIATPPPSTQMRSGSFEYGHDDDEDMAVHSPGAFEDDFEMPMSPLSNGHMHSQYQNTPLASPTFADRLISPRSRVRAEPHPQRYSYPSSSLEAHPESYSLTPPGTQPMESTPWSRHDPFMQVLPQSSPDDGKAEHWYASMESRDVTCGAHFGLGIRCNESTPHHHNYATPVHDQAETARLPHSPTPRGRRPESAEFSASALHQHDMYPMSPLMDHPLPYTPPRQPHVQQFSMSPAPQHRTPSYGRPSHQRSHTEGTNITSLPPSFLTKPAYMSHQGSHHPHYHPLPALPMSPSPPPTPQRSHRRSKSAHHRRKSSVGPSAASFVNYTPSDSRKILTGVAPSGSSKTKARREKEAADKRRKLSEAAMGAVLEAGGDLGKLERAVEKLEAEGE